MRDGHLGGINAVEHGTGLTWQEVRPMHFASFRFTLLALQSEQDENEMMLRKHLIEPGQSKWAALIAIAPKKDGVLGFWVNLPKLDATTVRDSYPLPTIPRCNN